MLPIKCHSSDLSFTELELSSLQVRWHQYHSICKRYFSAYATFIASKGVCNYIGGTFSAFYSTTGNVLKYFPVYETYSEYFNYSLDP
jgi:hypothetical protein